jgi:VCBS repeat-containing protein
MNFSWFAKVIQKVGASNKNRVKNRIRSNSRSVLRKFLRGFEALEDRRVLAAYSFINNGTTIQLNLLANEALTVTSSATQYTLSVSGGNWSGPNDGRVAGAGSSVLSVTDTPAISIIDGGANTSVTFGSSVSYVANVTVVLDDPAAGAITFNNPTSFVDTLGTTSFSASTSKNIVVNSGANITTVNGSLTLNANQQTTGTSGAFTGIDVNSATISTTGTGALSIAGKGGATSGVGVLVRGTGIVETTGTSSITVNGGTGASASLGIQLGGTAIVRKSTGTGSITLIGDTIDIGATTAVNAGTANSVTVRQRTNGVAINLGGADTLAATPVLGLTDAELDLIAAATVNIGNTNSGTVSVSAVISPLNYKTLAIGQNTSFGATSGFTSRVGATATTFDKISVVGTVAIAAGATFTPVSTGGYVPALLDSYRFLDNDSTDAITGSFTLPALTNFLGSTRTASASYAAGTGNDFVIAVPQNIAPTFNLGANPTVNEDAGPQTIVGFATGITSGGDPLPTQTLTFTTSGYNAALFSSAPVVSATNGTLTFTSAPDAFGVTAVILTLQDSGGTLNGGVDTTVKTFTITINPVNDAPVAVNDAGATTELGTTTGSGSVLSNDTDVDPGETATLVVAVPGTFVGTYGTLTLAADGTYSYTANANQLKVGQTVTDSFTYKAKDVNAALSNLATLVITITGENDAPTAVNDVAATTEIGTTTGSVLSNDTDPDTGETATLVVDAPGTFAGTNGTLTLNANGTYSYTANVNQLTVGQTVTDSFTYQAKDVNGALSNVATLVVTITGENDAPVAVNDAGATTELGTTTGSGSVLSNDTDPDTGETATLVVAVPGTFVGIYGTLTLAADGTYSYTGTANQLTVGQTVTDSFTYRAKDVNAALSNLATLVITITGENDAPVAVDDVGATTEVGTTTGAVLSNDTDPDSGETATLVVDVPGTFTGANGVLTLAANGTYSYTANAGQLTVGQSVTDSFTYQARDVNGALSNVATLVLTITNVNDIPVAVNDAAATTELGTTTGSGSVLSNDTDADSGETATLVVDAPGTFTGTYGTLMLAADGTFSYTANANQLKVGQTVTDSFAYKAKDIHGAVSNTASLVITITGENDTPTAVNDAAATTELGTTTGSVLSNDTDPDSGETATLVVDSPNTFVGAFGTLTLSANGAYSYTANANQLTVGQTVTDSFTYKAKDVNGALSNEATLVVTITGENDAPVAANDAAATTELGTTTGSGSVLSNDTDADTGETATLVVDAPGTFTGTYGTLTLAANGTFSYTANANQLTVGQTVTDNFTYKAKDVNGALSNAATLVITITGENDTPTAVNDAAATTETGTTTGSGSVLSNDTDPDTGETATLVVDAPGTFVGTYGTLVLAANGTFSYVANANQLTVGQTVTDSFTYKAKDVNGALSNTATLVVTITGENDAPVAANDAAATTELGTTTGSGSVLSNDTDADTGETATLVVDAPGTLVGTYGTLVLAANGTFSYTANANQLTVGQTVTDSFAYKAKDIHGAVSNTASLVITITGENDTPTAVNDAAATTELGTTTGSVLSNDTDPDSGETATLVVDAPGTFVGTYGTLVLAANGTFSYVANANQLTVGQTVTDSFTYKAKDVNGALSNTATLVLTITGENDAPVAANDAAATTELGTTTGSGSVLSNDTDADTGETATLVVDAPGTFTGTYGTLTLAANGTFSYTANANQLTVGQTVTDNFTYKAKDVNGALSNAATLVITITGENDTPTAVNDAAATTELGTTTGSVLSNDTDPDSGETATLVVEVPGTFTTVNGVLTLAANGSFSYTANANQLTVGQTVTDSFTYKAKDVNGALSNTATLVITITGENDAPVAVNDAAATTETGTTTGSGSVLSNDTDADTGETATLVVDAPGTFVGTYGTLVLAANGTFSYVANANQLAAGQTVTDSFAYKAKDVNGALSNTASLVITVTGENDAPTAVGFSLPASVNEGAVAAATITSVSDVDAGDTFTYNYVLKKNGVAVQTSGFVSAATFNLTPDDGGPGIVWTVEVQAKDAAGSLSPVSTQTLNVNNLPPVLTRVNASLSGNVGSTFTNTGTYADVSTDTVTLSADIGAIVNNGNGTWSWSYTPAAAVSNQVVTITGTDEDGGSSSVTFTFTAASAVSTIVTRGLKYVGATGSSASTSLATDKTALLPGQSSTFANYTSYSRGLNGVVVDVDGLPSGTTDSQMLASLQFAQWDGIAVAGFVALSGAAVPSVSILSGGGVGGSARVTISFPDNTVQNTWLRVTVLANADTGLAANDVFYFGNVIGEVNAGNTSTRYRVNAIDTSNVRNNQSPGANSASVTNIYDFNRDGRVNALDTSIVRNNQQTAGIVAPITAPSARAAGSSFGGGTGGTSLGRGVNLIGGSVPIAGITKNGSENSSEFAKISVLSAPEQLAFGNDQSTLPISVNSSENRPIEIDTSLDGKKDQSKKESVDDFFASLWNLGQ